MIIKYIEIQVLLVSTQKLFFSFFIFFFNSNRNSKEQFCKTLSTNHIIKHNMFTLKTQASGDLYCAGEKKKNGAALRIKRKMKTESKMRGKAT